MVRRWPGRQDRHRSFRLDGIQEGLRLVARLPEPVGLPATVRKAARTPTTSTTRRRRAPAATAASSTRRRRTAVPTPRPSPGTPRPTARRLRRRRPLPRQWPRRRPRRRLSRLPVRQRPLLPPIQRRRRPRLPHPAKTKKAAHRPVAREEKEEPAVKPVPPVSTPSPDQAAPAL